MESVTPSSAEQFAASRTHQVPAVEPLTGGVWSIPVPMPIPSLPYVLVYALECGSGLVLVDAGWGDDHAWHALNRGIATTGRQVTDVRAVLVTHAHRDHYGLADRVRQASGAWIGMHERDAKLVDAGPQVPADPRFSPEWLLECGVPPAEARDMIGLADRMHPRTTMAAPDRLLNDGERLRIGSRELTVVWTPGHSPGHLCFHDARDRRLYSGDHVLPRISSHVSVTSVDEDALTSFLDSQARLLDLPVDEVMPAHEYRFRGLRARVAGLQEHHAVRLREVADVLRDAPGQTAWSIAARLHWSHPWAQMSTLDRRSALGETLAHLSLLRQRGYVVELSRSPWTWGLGTVPAAPRVMTDSRKLDSQE